MSDDGPYGDLPLTRSLAVPARLLRWRFSRSSGPGGQGVNTADSRVELSVHLGSLPGWPPELVETVRERLAERLVDDTVTVVAAEHRQQLRNRQAARARMTAVLREAMAPPGRRRRATRPSAGARRRRLDSKKRRSQLKQGRRSTE